MFCPRCGQEQGSTELRFCSRCGLSLNLITDIVESGGALPEYLNLHKPKSSLTRNNGLKFGLIWFIFWCFVMTPVLAILGGDEIVAVAAVIGATGGFLIMLASVLFLKNPSSKLESIKADSSAANLSALRDGNQNALPPQQSIPVSNYAPPAAGSWRETNDLVQPPSVTEQTTKFLDDSEQTHSKS